MILPKEITDIINSKDETFQRAFNRQMNTPILAVDIIIEIEDKIVLIERKYPPLGYALPGGHVDCGETVEEAAKREAQEETNLEVDNLHMLCVESEPNRDPRAHIVSVVFVGQGKGTPKAQDDAKNLVVIPITNIKKYNLVLGHQNIIEKYIEWKKSL